MSRIKSAIELAMENTADVEADRGALKRAKAVKEAKKTVSLFLNGEDCEIFPDTVEEKEAYRETLVDSLLLNLKLPRENKDLGRLVYLEKGFSQLMTQKKDQEELTALFGQLKNFLAQYLDAREQLVENLIRQYEPQLRQKEAQLREQTGQDIRLTPDQDPEFLKFLQSQQQAMNSQYEEVIKQAKDQLKELL
jgi:hypothetical protein